MFPRDYFAPRYFPGRYFAEQGQSAIIRGYALVADQALATATLGDAPLATVTLTDEPRGAVEIGDSRLE